MTGPGSTHALATYSVLRIGASLCSFALATAERMTFSIIPLARCLEKRSIEIASSTSRPRPGFDGLLGAALVQRRHLAVEFLVNVRAFLGASAHDQSLETRCCAPPKSTDAVLRTAVN